MTHLPRIFNTRPFLLTRATALMSVCLFAWLATFAGASPAPSTRKMSMPDVLVLVASGFGADDMVSITYNSVVSKADLSKDIAQLKSLSGWNISSWHSSTLPAGAPKAKPNTSCSFQLPGIIPKATGTLPLEPFITALKRYKHLQFKFIVIDQFTFVGLQNFSNRYVDIFYSPDAHTQSYDVTVKDNTFTSLDLPKTSAEAATEPAGGWSKGAKIVVTLIIALIASMMGYFLTARAKAAGSKGTNK